MEKHEPIYDKKSFILGMVTAFSECVAGGCKRLALSPPLTRADYALVHEEAEAIIEGHGLLHLHEENLDVPPAERWEWILIAAKPSTLEEYSALRARGLSPARSLAPFSGLLSYDPAEAVHTGYDAYRAFFWKDGAKP